LATIEKVAARGRADIREHIKRTAIELLIRHGYAGFRFADIAKRLGVTRANIHYHFGTKEKLVEQAVDAYLSSTLDRFRPIWRDPALSFEGKVRATMEFNRERYLRFNRRADRGKPWSLIARMRIERDMLSRTADASLTAFAEEIDGLIVDAVEAGKRRGELDASAPVQDIAVQLSCIINSAGSITRDAGGFAALEQLYTAFARIIDHAYGRQERAAGAAPRETPTTAAAE
jgi:TetR/AcrR family transcriptional regulator, transcriptional repressor for nem operon